MGLLGFSRRGRGSVGSVDTLELADLSRIDRSGDG